MPIYEYQCDKCGRNFELLVFGRDFQIKCPHCGGKKASRRMSNFSLSGGQMPLTTGSGCGPSGGFS